jgi:cell division protein FtsB
LRIIRFFSPGRFLLVAIILVAGYLMFSAGTNLAQNFRLVTDEQKLQGNVNDLPAEVDQLNQIRDYLRSDEYVEYMARRVFGLVKPGEKLVAVQAPHDPPDDGQDSKDLTWWQRLFGGD